MTHFHNLLICLAMLGSSCVFAQAGPAQIVVVGTFHFSNPGKDIGHVQADNVFKPQRQLEYESLALLKKNYSSVVTL